MQIIFVLTCNVSVSPPCISITRPFLMTVLGRREKKVSIVTVLWWGFAVGLEWLCSPSISPIPGKRLTWWCGRLYSSERLSVIWPKLRTLYIYLMYTCNYSSIFRWNDDVYAVLLINYNYLALKGTPSGKRCCSSVGKYPSIKSRIYCYGQIQINDSWLDEWTHGLM